MQNLNFKTKVIAFYLPQFHPFPENDKWWGKGFTEWTNVGNAKKMFKGHYQPRVPADLGYYDLRLPQVREEQAELAKEAGVAAFCYWHYWFGNGKQLMDMPLQEVLRLGKPDFPFCLGWANHSWVSTNWNIEKSSFIPQTLMEQKYPGEQDIVDHFYKMLPAFKDKRYFRIHDKLLFLIYKIDKLPDFAFFKCKWNSLAEMNGLPKFFFVANSENITDISKDIYKEADAIALSRIFAPLGFEDTKIKKTFNVYMKHIISRFFNYPLNKYDYSKVIKVMDTDVFENRNVYPAIIPNWDPSPRRGAGTAIIYHNSTPELFKKHIKMVFKRIHNKHNDDRVVFLKSWNEWAEGNYMEPDLKWGKGYIQALREALEEDGYE